jgi:hypothetical protein
MPFSGTIQAFLLYIDFVLQKKLLKKFGKLNTRSLGDNHVFAQIET